MACSVVAVKVLQFLVIALLSSVTQGRTLHRIRSSHHGGSKTLAEVEEDLKMVEELEEVLAVHQTRTKHSKHRVSLSNQSPDHHEPRSDLRGSTDDRYPPGLPRWSKRLHAIRKRHNGANDDVAWEIMSRDEQLDYQQSRAHHRASAGRTRNKSYEVEVKEAQNSSLCNYTVVDIPDPTPDQSRQPKNLFHVMCNHAGSSCRDTGTYCCIQTYSKIQVGYSDGITETIKIYTGCVCSLRFYGILKPYKPLVPIND